MDGPYTLRSQTPVRSYCMYCPLSTVVPKKNDIWHCLKEGVQYLAYVDDDCMFLCTGILRIPSYQENWAVSSISGPIYLCHAAVCFHAWSRVLLVSQSRFQ